MSAEELVQQVYAAFNRRDTEGVLRCMTEAVQWPKASEGGQILGKDEIRAYWTRQWAAFDPIVTPVEVRSRNQQIDVTVHQVVRDLGGSLLSDQQIVHRYTLEDGLIARMEILGQSAPAFSRDTAPPSR